MKETGKGIGPRTAGVVRAIGAASYHHQQATKPK